MYREPRKRGASPERARQIAANRWSWWKNGAEALSRVPTVVYFDRLGLPRLP